MLRLERHAIMSRVDEHGAVSVRSQEFHACFSIPSYYCRRGEVKVIQVAIGNHRSFWMHRGDECGRRGSRAAVMRNF